MAKSVGLDIHARGVRAVELTGRGKAAKVTRYFERDLTPRGAAPDPEELRDALAEIFGKLSKHHVVLNLEAHETVVREIPVPFKADDQIRKVVKYEAEHHLHDCDADDVIVQYTRVGESGDGTNLLVFAARKDDISRRIGHARDAGVEPLMMDLDALATWNAVRVAGLLEETPHCALFHIGHRATGMVFVLDGDVRALRSVRLGVDSIAHGLARDMDIDFAEADSKLHELVEAEDGGDLFLPAAETPGKAETEKSHAELERDLFVQKRDELVARLKREYVRSAAALRGAGQPERILVTGPGLLVPGLLDLLGQRLGVAVEAFRPSQAFSCKLNGTSPEAFDAGATVALGLALKGGGQDPLGVDFRQEELKVANKFELLKNSLAVTVTLLFVGLLAFSFYCVIKKKQLQDDRFESMLTSAYTSFSDICTKYNGLGETIVPTRDQVHANLVESQEGERAQAISRFVRRLGIMRRKLNDYVGSGDDDGAGLPAITSALVTWNAVFSVLKDNHEALRFIDFEKIDIRQEGIRLTMIVFDASSAEKLERLLEEKVPVLKEMERERWSADDVRGTDYKRVTLSWKGKR